MVECGGGGYDLLPVNRMALVVKKPPVNVGNTSCGFSPWAGKIPWRRKIQLIPEFWPGEFHGLYSSWGHKESDMIEFHIQNSCLGNPTDREAWRTPVLGVSKESDTI